MPTPYPASRHRVVLVEDDAVSRVLVARIVALRPGTELVQCATGHDGVAAALADPPDLVLLDTRLPEVSGLEVVRTLRADPRTHFVPIVAVSAEAGRDHVDAVLAAGADDYLTKPIDVSGLLAVIDRFTPPRP